MKIHSFQALAGCLLLASGAVSHAASVTSVGTQENGGTFAVANWSNATVAKSFDIGATDLYGTAGYYQLLPYTGGAPGYYEAIGEPNNLGITLGGTVPVGQSTTLYSTPTFLTGNPLGGAGAYVNLGGYSDYRGPDGSSLVRQGALSLTLASPGTSPGGGPGIWSDAFTFTLTADASFRIGIAVDSVGSSTYAPNYVSVYNATNATTTYSAALTRDGVPDMVFFDITGKSGDQFTIALWQNSPDTGPAAFSLVTFDAIPSVGTEIGGDPYPVQNWSNAAVAKNFDIGGTELYGTDGYYQIRPSANVDIAEGVGGANDLGITAGADPSLHVQPSFTSALIGGAGTYVNLGGYSVYRGPDGSSLVRQGALSLNLTIPGTSPGGAAMYDNAFTFTLTANASFRLGIAVDSVGSGTYAPDYVSIYNSGTGLTSFSAALTRDGVPDMVFFDVAGNTGDQIVVALWQNSPGAGPAAFSLITFDLLPPAGVPTLSYSRSGNLFTLSWPQDVTGWTLESSIDLGINDFWDPVPGVVNNSVTLDMTGFPKNFFRLKSNP